MALTKTQKRLLIISAVLLLIALVVFVWREFNRFETPIVVMAPVVTPLPIVPTAPEASPTERNVSRLAMQFAERYGSYSNERNRENLRDLILAATAEFRAQLEREMKEPMSRQEFYGITTRALSVKIAMQGEGSAIARVGTQRVETKGGERRVFNQDLRLDFVKIAGEWKTDSAAWVE